MFTKMKRFIFLIHSIAMGKKGMGSLGGWEPGSWAYPAPSVKA